MFNTISNVWSRIINGCSKEEVVDLSHIKWEHVDDKGKPEDISEDSDPVYDTESEDSTVHRTSFHLLDEPKTEPVPRHSVRNMHVVLPWWKKK